MTYNKYPFLIIFTIFDLIFIPFFIIAPSGMSFICAAFTTFSSTLFYIDFIKTLKAYLFLTKHGKHIIVTPIKAVNDHTLSIGKSPNLTYSKRLICSYIDEFGNEYELKSEQTFKNLQDWLIEYPNTQLNGYIDPNDNTKYLIPIKQLDLTHYDDLNADETI